MTYYKVSTAIGKVKTLETEIFLVTPGEFEEALFLSAFWARPDSLPPFRGPVVGVSPSTSISWQRAATWAVRFLFSHLIGFPRTEVSSPADLTSSLLPVGHPEKEETAGIPHLADVTLPPFLRAPGGAQTPRAAASAGAGRLLDFLCSEDL